MVTDVAGAAPQSLGVFGPYLRRIFNLWWGTVDVAGMALPEALEEVDAPAPTAAPASPTAATRRLYVPVGVKFAIAVVIAAAWLGAAVVLSMPWERELSADAGPVVAWTVIVLPANMPGFLVAFLAASLLLDRQPPLRVLSPTTALTIVIAAPQRGSRNRGHHRLRGAVRLRRARRDPARGQRVDRRRARSPNTQQVNSVSTSGSCTSRLRGSRMR